MSGVLKDSGERKVFSTGAQRDRQRGKGMPSLVPSWIAGWLLSRVYEDGAYKYAFRNWEKGMPLSQYIDSAERHLAKLKMGMRDEPHATQVIWNIVGYIFTAAMIKMGFRPVELNDMPDQLSADPAALAEPLSPYEYSSLESFTGRKMDADVTHHELPEKIEEGQQRVEQGVVNPLPPADPKYMGHGLNYPHAGSLSGSMTWSAGTTRKTRVPGAGEDGL